MGIAFAMAPHPCRRTVRVKCARSTDISLATMTLQIRGNEQDDAIHATTASTTHSQSSRPHHHDV